MAFAIIQTGGKQYKVSPGEKIRVEKLAAEAGTNFVFDKVLLIAEERGTGTQQDAEVKIGTPYVAGAKVSAEILKQDRADKKIVFKYHSKTRYRKKKGHRQHFTEVRIIDIK